MARARLVGPVAIAIALATQLATAASAAPEEPGGRSPAVSAVITHETIDVDAEGVTRTSRYQERLVRTGEQVWIERIFPAGLAPAAARDAHEINVRVAARWFTRVGKDDVRVALVSAADRVVFDLRAEELEDFGLGRRFAIAGQLVDLAALAPLDAAAPDGARWYQRTTASGYVRVLWSTRLALPLLIESGTSNGRSQARTTVQPEALAAGARRPWDQVASFAHRELSDLAD